MCLNASVIAAGMRACANLAADNNENSRLLGAAGACEGEGKSFCFFFSIRHAIADAFAVVVAAVVVEFLQGPFSNLAGVVEQGLWAIRNLAVREDNSRRFGAAGACNGE